MLIINMKCKYTLPTDSVLFWTSKEHLWPPESILRTSENIYKCENILRTNENIWEPIIVSLGQFEKDFNTHAKMSADIVFLFDIFDHQKDCENGAKVFVIVFVFMQTAIDGTGVVFV